MPGGRLDQHAVEIGPPHREDDLVLALTVGLQGNRAGAIVDHTPAHRYQQRPHAFQYPGALERTHAARGEREIDGAAALGSRLARVRAALVERDREAAPRQEQRQQRAGEAGTHDVDARPRGQLHGLACSVSRRARAKRQASSKRLKSGTGATRMMSGERQSHTTPCAASASNTCLPRCSPAASRSES